MEGDNDDARRDAAERLLPLEVPHITDPLFMAFEYEEEGRLERSYLVDIAESLGEECTRRETEFPEEEIESLGACDLLAVGRITVEQLIRIAAACSDDVREDAAKALGWSGQQVAIDALTPMLQDRLQCVRIAAIEALAWLECDEIDKRLLSRDFDGMCPCLDLPQA